MNVLVSLHPGYGLGDAVQVSVVLQHLQRRHPSWIMDYQAEDGYHQVGCGIANHTFARGEPYPTPHYDAEIQLLLYDKWWGFTDRPNTHISACLRDCCGLDWNAACSKYCVGISAAAEHTARMVVSPNATRLINYRQRTVAFHYQGDSARANKDLTNEQAVVVCRTIERLGATVLLIDWRNISPLPSRCDIRTTGKLLPASLQWGGSAEVNCAIIRQCNAFIGIDSGPAKCAGATDTPSLVVWTGHHPARFYDPCSNVTHLLPTPCRHLLPFAGGDCAHEWFCRYNRVRYYDGNPMPEITTWLLEVLS